MEGLAPAFPTHLDEPIDDEDSAEFTGFTDEEIREAEDKLQDHLEDDQTLASFVDRWADIDNTCAVDEPLTSDQIAADAIAVTEPDNDETSVPVQENVVVALPTATEAAAAFQTALWWLEGQDTDYVTVMHVSNLLQVAKYKQQASRKQQKVTDFFTCST